MAVTITDVRPTEPTMGDDGGEYGLTDSVAGQGLQERIIDIAWDSSYPTGGEAVSLAQLGLTSALFMVTVEGNGYFVKHDRTNNKVLMYQQDSDAVADGPLIQVANTTDLSAITTRVLVVGRKSQSAP